MIFVLLLIIVNFQFVIFRPYFIWERKIFKSNGFFFFFFFIQNLPRFYLYLNLRVLPIEFNPHKFSFVRYVFVEIFEVFLKNDENDENDPLMTKWPRKWQKFPNFSFLNIFMQFLPFFETPRIRKMDKMNRSFLFFELLSVFIVH